MMSDVETRRVKLWQVASTEKAYLFSTMPKNDPGSQQIWIPRSQIAHISRMPVRVNQWQECIVDVAEWLAEKHQL